MKARSSAAMSWELTTLVIKLAALWSFCGGPLLITDRLKPEIGMPAAFLIAFLPIGLMLLGAFHLEDDPDDRWVRWAVELGRLGMVVMVGMQLYGIWLILGGLRRPDQFLYYTGIVVGLVSAVAYQMVAARWAARRARSAGAGLPDDRPIEPS